ncbi:MAG: hypothetical protein ACTSQI_20875 [Candidatus Helarchaeota archaeon]
MIRSGYGGCSYSGNSDCRPCSSCISLTHAWTGQIRLAPESRSERPRVAGSRRGICGNTIHNSRNLPHGTPEKIGTVEETLKSSRQKK